MYEKIEIKNYGKIFTVYRESPAYKTGRIVGRLILVGLGYIFGKRWSRKPIDKSFPEKGK